MASEIERQSWPASLSMGSMTGLCGSSASEHGCLLVLEARDILRAVLDRKSVRTKNLGTLFHALFKPFGGVEFEIPPERADTRTTAQRF